MNIKSYEQELKFYAELFAYITFANIHTNHLYRTTNVHEISGFNVYLFFNEYEPEIPGEDPVVEMNCRITIKGSNEKGAQDVQIMYTEEVYFDAIIDQIYQSTGAYQHFEFSFDVPNELKLYDAEFLIEEKLGVTIDDE